MPKTTAPFPTPRPGSLTDEALQRGRQYHRRRLVATRGATGGALLVVVAVAIALRVAGAATPHVVTGHHPSTTTFPPSSTVSTTVPPPTTTTPGHPTTAVHVLTVWTPSGTISSQVTIGQTVSGSCQTGSRVVDDPSAWRCTEANFIYDPCISPDGAAATATEVVCLAAPWSDAVLLRLTSPLPVGAGSQSTGGQSTGGSTVPWAVELASGQRCVSATGAVLTVQGVALNYQCAGIAAAGGIETGHEPWTAELDANATNALRKVAVTASWTVAPAPTGPASGSGGGANAKWDAPQLLLTATSLGAVKSGMTLAQAEAAAGEQLIAIGDGMYSNVRLVNNTYVTEGDPGLEASFNSATVNSSTTVTYFCATTGTGQKGAPVVTTPEGFTVGASLASLRSVYGSKLTYVPARTGGINPAAAYEVHEDGGTLVFYPSGSSSSSLVDMVQAGTGATAGAPC